MDGYTRNGLALGGRLDMNDEGAGMKSVWELHGVSQSRSYGCTMTLRVWIAKRIRTDTA
jgi:hypothetical protein